MKGLLIKDFRILGKQKLLLILILVMAVMFPFGSDDGFSATYTTLMLGLLTISTISYDEMNGGMLFLLSLPTGRTLYVKEKYTLAGLNLLLATMVSLLSGCAASAVKQTSGNLPGFLLSLAGTACVVAVMISVAIPLTLKFGAEKGRMIVSIATIGVGAILISAYKVLVDVLHVDIIGGMAKMLGGIESEAAVTGILAGSLLLVLLLVLFCSYLIANKIMKKKEF